MACEVCVGVEEGVQEVGAVRSIVSNLKCRCPLQGRGCEWEGVVGEMAEHMESCDQFIVQCPYYIYGCVHQLKRGDKDTHKREEKDYHNELMSVFMLSKIEELENEKMQQAVSIKSLQETISVLSEKVDYMKLNGIVWKISDRNRIKNVLQRVPPNPQVDPNAFKLRYNSEKRLKYEIEGSEEKFTTYNGPSFILDPFYVLFPQLTVNDYTEQICLNLVSLVHKGCMQSPSSNWPLQGTCKVILLNRNSIKKEFVKEIFFVLNINETIVLTDIPSHLLLGEKCSDNGVVTMKLLFKIY